MIKDTHSLETLSRENFKGNHFQVARADGRTLLKRILKKQRVTEGAGSSGNTSVRCAGELHWYSC
jgi:hypothetical protein